MAINGLQLPGSLPSSSVDFSPLADLGKIYEKAKTDAAKKEILAAAQLDGTPQSLSALATKLLPYDQQGAMTLSQLANTQANTLYSRGRDEKNDTRQASLDERQLRQDALHQQQWNASFGLQKAASERAGEDKYTIKDVVNPDGTTGLVRVKTTGGEGPIPGTTSARQPRQMSFGDITKLTEEGQKYSTLNGVTNKFEDRFAGYLPGTGDANMTAGRYLPEGMVGKDRAEGSAYWQEYDRYKNVVRNELFGASLTAGESKAFSQADINPSMQPEQIRKNLAIQKSIVESGMRRKAQAAVTSGYDPKAIGQAYGVDLTRADPAVTATMAPADQGQAANPATFRAPPKMGELRDGYRFKGGNPGDPASWVKASN